MDIKEKASCTTKGPFFINLDTEHINKKLKIMSAVVDKSNSQDVSNASNVSTAVSTTVSTTASTAVSTTASITASSVASQISKTKSEDSWAMVEQHVISEAKSEDSWMLVN